MTSNEDRQYKKLTTKLAFWKINVIIRENILVQVNRKGSLLASVALLMSGMPLVQAEEIISFSQEKLASNSIESSMVERELDIENRQLKDQAVS